MEENYFIARYYIKQKYEGHPYYPLFVVAMFSFLEKYPEYHNLIIYLFLATNIYIDNDRIQNILDKNHITHISFDEEEEFETFAISCPQDVVLFQDGDLIYCTKDPVIVCSSLSCSKTQVLNIFLHEMNHLIKGAFHAFSFDENKDVTTYSIRIGLNTHYYYYDKAHGNLWENAIFNLLDEVVNVMQTTELTEHVFALEKFIEDEDILDYLHSLDYSEACKDFGYEYGVILLRPLWKDELFRQIIEDDIVLGNVSRIVKRYDHIMGDSAFEKLSYALEIVDECHGNTHGKQYRYAKKYIKNAVKRFPKEKVKSL